ncbi:MAG: VPLPA-CTERM sorting domain-containing protein [Pseudomonadota bacterium]
MKKSRLSGPFVLFITTLVLCHGAHASFIYDVERSLACTNDCSGNITVDGYLETDSLGTLGLANFTDWMLTFNSTNFTNTVLTPSNSEILLQGIGGSVVATMDELIITQPGLNSSDDFIFAVKEDFAEVSIIIVWQFQGGDGSSAQEIITNSPNASFDPFDQGTLTYIPDPLIVSLPAIIPLPAAIWLFGSGLLGLIGISRRKKAA